MLDHEILLFHHKAHPHAANETQSLTGPFGWGHLKYPPRLGAYWTLDWSWLGAYWIHIFLHLEQSLADQQYNDVADMKNAEGYNIGFLTGDTIIFFEEKMKNKNYKIWEVR